jgi:hypothetical protein
MLCHLLCLLQSGISIEWPTRYRSVSGWRLVCDHLKQGGSNVTSFDDGHAVKRAVSCRVLGANRPKHDQAGVTRACGAVMPDLRDLR